MPVMKYRSRTLAGLSQLIPEITYVMCGAREETGKLPIRGIGQVKYIGFEADPRECERLQQNARPGFRFENAAIAGSASERTLYVTRDPACSSLLRPNAEIFARLLNGEHATEVVQEKKIQTISLDEVMSRLGVPNVDVLDLDTQGTELEILHGAAGLLSTSIVAIKVEVEFAPLYQDQALFGDVDEYLRKFGFALFDLSRSRYRRKNLPSAQLTRGQLLWGDALYLRDYRWFAERSELDHVFRLCLVAAHLGFHDYALEGMDLLLEGKIGTLSQEQEAKIRESRKQYTTDLRNGARWVDVLLGFEAVGLIKPLKATGRIARQIGERLVKDKEMTQHNWVD